MSSRVYYGNTVGNEATPCHLMLVRRIMDGHSAITWASAENPKFTPMHYYEMLITEGERMEILGYYPRELTTHQMADLRYRAVAQHMKETEQ